MAKNYALTGCIPIGYGGLTTALLNRSAQLSLISKEPVQILTFRDREFPQTILEHLKERNGLRNGVTVINIYDWLRNNQLTCGGQLFDYNKHHIPTINHNNLSKIHTDEENGIILRELIQEKNVNGWVQVNHLRADGTIAVIDNRRDQGRCIITCDEQGNPQRIFPYSWPFYHAWLDTLFQNQSIDIIVDNDHEARFLTDYQRDNVSIIHYFHGTHCNESDEILPYAEFVFSRLDRFDLFVFPTFSQCYKAQEMFPHYSGFEYIPHALPEKNTINSIKRQPQTFVIASRLETIKRLHHAVWAVGEVSKTIPNVHMHILGTGSLLQDLQKQAENIGNFVTFHGHCNDVNTKFKQFSFYLLTSISEGLPIALLEAMQAGCIPIAYNINFGPSDVIIHGVNGWLVEAGNQEALCQTIQMACNLSEKELQTMRLAAMESAKDFSVKHVLSEWNRCKLAARKRKAEKMQYKKLLK